MQKKIYGFNLNRKDYNRVISIIQSCETLEQLSIAENYWKVFMKYDPFWGHKYWQNRILDELMKQELNIRKDKYNQ